MTSLQSAALSTTPICNASRSTNVIPNQRNRGDRRSEESVGEADTARCLKAPNSRVRFWMFHPSVKHSAEP